MRAMPAAPENQQAEKSMEYLKDILGRFIGSYVMMYVRCNATGGTRHRNQRSFK
jgi:hypothetical protein